MPVLSNKPVTSKFQVGEFVFFVFNNSLFYSKIIAVFSDVSNPLNTNDGVQSNRYYFENFDNHIPESSIFENASVLVKKQTNQFIKDFSTVDFLAVDFQNLDLSGCNFAGAKLDSVNFTGADIRGSNFTGANLPGAITSKEDLRDYVGVGNYDEKTIWTDGSSVESA